MVEDAGRSASTAALAGGLGDAFLVSGVIAAVATAVDETGNDRLQVGFNRRFAPLLVKARSQFGQPRNSTVRYLVNAGPLGADSWYRNRSGRVVTTSPWRLADYWKWTRAPDLKDYTLTR